MVTKTKNYYINDQIRFREVMVIDETGNNLGKLNINDALNIANNKGLDLVCINTKYPFTCKLMNYSKFLYEQKKKYKEMKKSTKQVETKHYKFRFNIDKHDLDTKIRQMQEHLDEGNNVHIILIFRGREITRKSMGLELVKDILKNLKNYNITKNIDTHDMVIECIIQPKNKSK